ncbi:MAG: hypothetical protein H6704_14650 [Myxococcales bacterium]|nr:hypothetical protein [Myxococcales bacterium]
MGRARIGVCSLLMVASMVGCDLITGESDAGLEDDLGGPMDGGRAEAGLDAAIPDATLDAAALPDAAPDATLDAAALPDAAPDAKRDAGADAARDAGLDATPDAGPDATPDALPDGAADGSLGSDAAPAADGGAPDALPDAWPPDGPGCRPGLEISGDAPALPAAVFGHYDEATDCSQGEGAAWFGGTDFTRCFRKSDGSDWRVWNSGCGWVIGPFGGAGGAEDRALATWSGPCADLPPRQRDTRALTTGVLYDGFGARVDGVRIDHCPAPTPCDPGVVVDGAAEGVPADVAGTYTAATCVEADGGGWFGGVDYGVCFEKDDGSGWRIWNSGCGWQVGRHEGQPPAWRRVAQTYGGACADLPVDEREPSALNTGVLYDAFGRLLEGLRIDQCRTPSGFAPGVQVIAPGRAAAYAGHYVEARDCALGEGGAWFGGVDYTRCFRKADRSGWVIWNSGCGWELGRVDAGEGWQREATTYVGACAEIPEWQRDLRGLGGFPLRDGFGARIEDLRLVHTPAPCADTGATVTVDPALGPDLPIDMGGRYVEARDCALDEAGAWFGGDFTRCFRKDDGSSWRIWNTGCGWEIGRVEGADGWQRYGLTYVGPCADAPEVQLDGRALTTGVLFDGFGARVMGLRVDHCEDRDWAWRY